MADSEETEVKYILPKYLGHPGYVFDPVEMNTSGISFETKIDQSLQIAYLHPLNTEITGDLNVYRGVDGWDEYVEYLAVNNVGVPADIAKSKRIAAVCSVNTPMAESYTNEYGQSQILSGLVSRTSGGWDEISFMSGGLNADNFKNKGGMIGTLGDAWGWTGDTVAGAAEWISNVTQLGNAESIKQDVAEMIKNPGSKLDIPTMWKGSSCSVSYELSIRLNCFNSKNDKQYGSGILAPLVALLQFVTPRSNNGKFYTWPFLLELNIPGCVYLPLAYCSNMTVLKGGDVNDISWCGRPNMIDVRMSINSVYGVTVNSKDSSYGGDRPSIMQQLLALNGMDDRGGLKQPVLVEEKEEEKPKKVNYVSTSNASGSDTVEDTSRTKEKPDEEKDAMKALNALVT